LRFLQIFNTKYPFSSGESTYCFDGPKHGNIQVLQAIDVHFAAMHGVSSNISQQQHDFLGFVYKTYILGGYLKKQFLLIG